MACHSLGIFQTECNKTLEKVLTSKTFRIPILEFQSFFKTFTQISPELLTLGWKILVTKKPFGGVAGN